MILRNFMFRGVAIVITLLSAMILTPLMIRYLGESDYGLWLLMVSFGAFMGLLDLGLTVAIPNFLNVDLANGDMDGIRETVTSALMLYYVMAVVVMAVHLVLGAFGPNLFHVPPEKWTRFFWAVVVLGVSSALGFPARVYDHILFAKEQHHLVASLESLNAILRPLAVYAVLVMGWGLVGLASVQSGLLLAVYVATYQISYRRLPQATRLRPGWSWSKVRKLMIFGRDVMLGNLGQQVEDQSPTLLLGMVSSTEVARFGVGTRLVKYGILGVYTTVGVFKPRFVTLWSLGEHGQLRELFMRSLQYAGILAGCIGLGLGLLGPDFILLWVGPSFAVSQHIIRLVAFPTALFLALLPCQLVLLALGLHRRTAYALLIEAVITAAGSLALMRDMGALGAALSLAVALTVVRPFMLPGYVCRNLRLSLWRFWLVGMGRPALASLAAGSVMWALLRWWPLSSWLHLVAAGLALIAIYALATWLLVLDREEKGYWLGWLLRFRPGRRA